MTEYEKMKAGLCYRFDAEILEKMYRGHELADAFNQTAARDGKTRTELLLKLLDAPEDICIEPPFHCDFGENIHVGHHFFANFGCTILDGADVTIGDRVLFGPMFPSIRRNMSPMLNAARRGISLPVPSPSGTIPGSADRR